MQWKPFTILCMMLSPLLTCAYTAGNPSFSALSLGRISGRQSRMEPSEVRLPYGELGGC
jgi:hypothetical protein